MTYTKYTELPDTFSFTVGVIDEVYRYNTSKSVVTWGVLGCEEVKYSNCDALRYLNSGLWELLEE